MDDSEDGPPLLKRDKRNFKIAKLAARHSTASNFRIGAVIAKGRKVLGVGFNDPFKTHPKSNTPYQFIHAELAALINARCDVTGAVIYVFRAGQNERPLLAKPCEHCMELIKRAGIKAVFFSIHGGYDFFILNKDS